MQINTYSPSDDASKIQGFTIVVDILRAFSTAYYIHQNKPKKYIVTDNIEHAFSLKIKYKNVLLIGERQGIKIDGFDFGNSPTEVINNNFNNNCVVHTTTAGTKGLLLQPPHNEVIIGGFINCDAIHNYIKSKNIEIINIYCTAPKDSMYGEEDYLFVEYFTDKLLEKPTYFEKIVTKIRNGTGKGFKNNGFAPYTDLLYCLDYSRFDYILKKKIVFNEEHSVELIEMKE